MQVPGARIYFPEEDKKDIAAKIEEILITGQLTLGKYGREFEEAFARYTGTKYALAVNSGTSALEIILRTLDIQGYSVIVPPNTFLFSRLPLVLILQESRISYGPIFGGQASAHLISKYIYKSP